MRVKNTVAISEAIAARLAQLGFEFVECSISLEREKAAVIGYRPNKYSAGADYATWSVFWPDGIASLAFHWGHYDQSRDAAGESLAEKMR